MKRHPVIPGLFALTALLLSAGQLLSYQEPRRGGGDLPKKAFEIWVQSDKGWTKYSDAETAEEANKVASSLKPLTKIFKGVEVRGNKVDDDALKRALAKVARMIAGGRALGYTQAAANLENWRDAKGDRVMAAAEFSSERFILDRLRDSHREKYILGAENRLRDMKITVGVPFDMMYENAAQAPYLTDLFFALGGMTLKSKVTAVVVAGPGGKHTLKFNRWETMIEDVYNWDVGKSTPIPGVGTVTDDEMLALEKAGYGKNFKITTPWFPVSGNGITDDARLNR